jgi:glycosyltransferase involved in cell wall biosynthesis
MHVPGNQVTDQAGPSQAATDGRVRVLVVGPCSAVGGLAQVARQTLTGFDADHFDIAARDVTRVRRAGHGRLASLSAHGRQWWGLARALRANPPAVVHLHTCSYGTYYRTLADVLACRLCRCPYVLHVHGGLFAEFLDGLRGGRRRRFFICP